MGLSFSDGNWNKISDATPAIITGAGYNQYNVSGKAPANTSYVSMWLYSENLTAVDNCTLMLNEPPPPPPPSPNSNLLENSDFEISIVSGQDSSWTFDCAALFSEIDPSFADVYEGNYAINLQDGTCMDQSLSASDIEALKDKEFTYSCYVKNPRSYGSISIFFDDQPIFQEVENSTSYQLVEIKGTAPANMTNGFVSAYADDLMSIDSCSLTFEGGDAGPIIINESRVLETTGSSFDIEGNRMAVATRADRVTFQTPSEITGKVEVYSKTATGWQKDAEIVPNEVTSSFGSNIKLYNGELFVTSDQYVFVYSKNPSTTQWELIQTLEDPNWESYAFINNLGPIDATSIYSGGLKLAVNDNTLVISGASVYTYGIHPNYTYKVSIFDKSEDSNLWEYKKTFDGGIGNSFNRSRHNILLNGDELYINIVGRNESFLEYYKRNVGGVDNWGTLQKFPSIYEDRGFGKNIVRTGNYLIISKEESTQLFRLTANETSPWDLVGDFLTLFPDLPSKSLYLDGNDTQLLVSNLDPALENYESQEFGDLIFNVLNTSDNNYENWKVVNKIMPQSIQDDDRIFFGRKSPSDSNTFGLLTSSDYYNPIAIKNLFTFEFP